MSGINKFLARRDWNRNGSRQKKVMSPSPLPPAPAVSPVPLSLDGQCASSCTTGVTDCFPSSRRSSSSSLCSLSLAFQDLPTGKGAPHVQATETLVYATTANSLDRYILQPELPSGQVFGLFTPDKKNAPGKDEKEKVKQLTQRLSRVGITTLEEAHVRYALGAKESSGDVEKAFNLLVLFQQSLDGVVREYNPDVKLLGAVNREGVTCYLDALLFAMFARLGSFEAILYNTFDDEPRKRLAIVLRLWVNMLRTGKLITTDITKTLQETLAACGWETAAELKQQDTSEAFTFITEKLELPLLTLKMDIFHTGKEDADDDHKFVNERLLEVAIPEDHPDGRPITLEECLEMYFNNKIEVKRHLERRSTMTSLRSRRSMDSNKAHALHIETTEMDNSRESTPTSPSFQNPGVSSSFRTRHRAPSLIQERIIEEEGAPSECSPGGDGLKDPTSRGKGSIVRKEVMMPAWQFFSLIPWYTDNAPTSDAQVAAHFSSKRPILGLCLKRYSYTLNGSAVRRNTYVDIPIEIGLPHFIHDDGMEDGAPLYGNFKLSLQSVVCHRGASVDSGHYISLVRGTAPNARKHNGPSETGSTVPAQKPEDRWMRFDDLADERISYVDIEKALKEESPYLLFYQVQPIDYVPPETVPSEDPPSYYESEKKHSDFSDPSLRSNNSSCEDAVENGRPSLDGATSDDPPGRSSASSDQRASIALTDGSGAALRPDHTNTGPANPNDEALGSSWRISRRGSMFGKSKSKSRPSSQSGENSLSTTFSKLALRLNKDKLWVPNGNGNVDSADEGAANALDGEGTAKGSGTETRKLKRAPKEKSKTRTQEQEGAGKGDEDDVKAPDRECVVM